MRDTSSRPPGVRITMISSAAAERMSPRSEVHTRSDGMRMTATASAAPTHSDASATSQVRPRLMGAQARLATCAVAISSSSSDSVAAPEQVKGFSSARSPYLSSSDGFTFARLTWPMVQAAEAPLTDFLEIEDAHLLVPAVARNGVVQLAHLVTAALQHLDEHVVAIAEDAGDTELRVVRARLLEDRVVHGHILWLGGAAGVQESDEHGRLSRSG